MSPIDTYLVATLAAAFTMYVIVISINVRSVSLVLWHLVPLGCFLAALHFANGFPRPMRHFGPSNAISALGLMTCAVLLGMAAQYFFYPRKRTWRSFVRPFLVSPIVLLPLVGAIPAAAELGAMQYLSMAILAFQNGFFWRAIFEKGRPA